MQSSDAPNSRTGTPWAAAVASLLCSVATWYYLQIYSIIHWEVLGSEPKPEFEPAVKDAIFQTLLRLEAYRLFGVLAVAFAVWAILSKPRWVGVICAVPALFALFLSFIIM